MSASARNSLTASVGSTASVDAGSDVEVLGGGRLTGVVAESAEMVTGSVSVGSAGAVEMASSGDMSLMSSKGLVGEVLGELTIGASSGTVEIASGASGVVGGAASVAIGGDASLGVVGSGTGVFASDVSMVGADMLVESRDDLAAAAQSVEMTGSRGACADGSLVEMVDSGVQLSSTGSVIYRQLIPFVLQPTMSRSARHRAWRRRCSCSPGWM